MLKRSLYVTGFVSLVFFVFLAGCSNFAGSNQERKTVSIAQIEGVDPPVTGATGKTEIKETGEYSGTIQWAPSLIDGKFAAGQVYIATITLKAKANYTLTGVKKNFFKLPGGQATNPAHSGIIKASFPKTADSSGGGTLPPSP
jgi:fructan beta-fructosidase